MNKLTHKLQSFAHQPEDTEDVTLSKKLILNIAISCCVCGLLWSGIYYSIFGVGLTMALPLVFVVIVGISILISYRIKDHRLLIYAELICITFIPVLMQWSIGSMDESGVVITWCFMGPIGAIIFLTKRHAIFWMLLFLIIVSISAAFEPKLLGYATPVSDKTRALFYIMNLGASSLIVFAAAFYFVNELIKQKLKNAELLKITREKNEQILDSITYARRIQSAILPQDHQISESLPDHFILYKPKDIVSGDFYWMKQINDQTIIAAVDCTGHGVPGAFMSMLGMAFLNEIVKKEKVKKASDILNELRLHIKTALHQEGKVGEAKDGMDIALCIIDHKNMKIQYAGAYNPLYLIRKNSAEFELIEKKADKMPIGIHIKESESFTNHDFVVKKSDTIYLFSDGFHDQFGGKENKKFMTKNFKKLLLEIQVKTMTDQKKILDKTIEEWKNIPDKNGNPHDQLDDILVIGVRL